MKVRVEVVCLNAAGDERRRQVLTIERRELAMDSLDRPSPRHPYAIGYDFVHKTPGMPGAGRQRVMTKCARRRENRRC